MSPSSCSSFVVAPHAGAWIETVSCITNYTNRQVAPHAGAWIETTTRCGKRNGSRSPLTQGRGLKLTQWVGTYKGFDVAPHAGAWIETENKKLETEAKKSPLTQGRGLKPDNVTAFRTINSRPSRRGVD